MSEILWRAVLVAGETARVWQKDAGGGVTEHPSIPLSTLGDMPGPIIAAGLDGATVAVPAKPNAGTTHADGLPHVAAIPMLRQDAPAALSWGAETALAGYLSREPGFDGVLLVLGHDSCWAHISAEEVVSFQTFLTARLAHALGAKTPVSGPAFDAALSETLSRPDRLAQHLASARAAGTGQDWAHLIGAEIASAKPYWLGQRVVILASPGDAAPYITALERQGAMVEQADLNAAYIAGFEAAWARITDHSSN